jgi:hypothetical protein
MLVLLSQLTIVDWLQFDPIYGSAIYSVTMHATYSLKGLMRLLW